MSTAQSELKRILRMVEEKKISAEDAERLIEALNSGRKKPEGVFTILEEIGEKIKGMKGFGAKKKFQFKGKNRLILKGLSGDIKIRGEDTDEITLSCDGFIKVDEDRDTVRVKGMSGDMQIVVPKKSKLSIGSASGDMNIDSVSGELDLRAAAGDIAIGNFDGRFDIAGAFGDLDLDLAHLEDGKIKAAFGDITITLNPDDDITIEIKLKKGGKIENDAGLEVIEEGKGYLTAKLNEGKKRLKIEGTGGTVVLKRR